MTTARPSASSRTLRRAFHRCALELANGLKHTKQFGLYGIPTEDFRAYPVVFLYRHSLELHMKAVILAGDPLLSLNEEAPIDHARLLNTHNLETLRTDVSALYGVRMGAARGPSQA